MTITVPPTGGGTATDADKRHAAGRAEEGSDVYARAWTAVFNCQQVARLHGSGHWTEYWGIGSGARP